MYNSLRLYIGVPHMKSNMMDRVPLHPTGECIKKSKPRLLSPTRTLSQDPGK